MKHEVQQLVAEKQILGKTDTGSNWLPSTDDDLGMSRYEYAREFVCWHCYLAFCAIIPSERAGLKPEAVEAERRRFPQFFDGTIGTTDAFQTLAFEWCGLSPERAQAIYGEAVSSTNPDDMTKP